MTMEPPRIAGSSYSNTAPLIWSFLYGSNHGKVELILDNAPARSAELLSKRRVDAALVPVIAYQTIEHAWLVPDVCVGARERVQSVCLVSKPEDLREVRCVALDASSRTSIALTKIIFREFYGFEPVWKEVRPDLNEMLFESDAALIIGDPALRIAEGTMQSARSASFAGPDSASQTQVSGIRVFDLAQLWHRYTGLGFVFAMWMACTDSLRLDFAGARDEGLRHIEEIISNYQAEIGIGPEGMRTYLLDNISYSIDDSMQAGMELFFKLAQKNGLTERNRPLEYLTLH